MEGEMTTIPRSSATLRVVLTERIRPGAPQLERLLPSSAAPGDNLFLEGRNLAGADLRVDFGPVSTWAVALDERIAFCVVPQDAEGPVTISRFGLRSKAIPYGGGDGDDPTRVVRVDPADGLSGVFRDTPVLVRLSRPLDGMTVCAETVRVEYAGGRVRGRLRLSPDGRVLIWRGERLLEVAAEHVFSMAGVRDVRGREVLPHRSRFVPSTLTWAELTD
jgi:hypothetical protein